MPKLYTEHQNAVRLERELEEIWNVLDKLGVREGRLRALTRGTPGGPAPLLTAKGDLLTRDASQDAVLRAGADNEILTADAAEAVGLKWSSSLADHLADTVDPHGSTMQVAARLITQEVFATAVLGLTVNSDAFDTTVVINNDDATKKCSLSVEKNIIVGGEVDGRKVGIDGAKLDALVADDLNDVDTVTEAPVLNEVLKWNGTNWVPGTAGNTTEFTFSIDTFDDGISNADDTQLIGAGTWKAVGEVSFTATYSNPPGGMTATVAMSGSDVDWAGDLSMTGTPPEGATTNTELVKYPTSQGGTITFTLSQTADGSQDNETVDFNNTMRHGNSSLTQGNQTELVLEGLNEEGSATSPNESRSQTINNIPTTANQLVFAYADRLGAVAEVLRDSGDGFVTASFDATRTNRVPLEQTGVTNVVNSAGYSETFACVTSTDTDLANGSHDFKLLASSSQATNYIYWGELNKASGYTEADVETNFNAAQPGKVASSTMSSRSMTVNATGSEHAYIAYPARMGALTSIVIGGFESIGDFNVDTITLAVTNDAGFQENYRVYVSVNPGFTDPTTMTVTI